MGSVGFGRLGWVRLGWAGLGWASKYYMHAPIWTTLRAGPRWSSPLWPFAALFNYFGCYTVLIPGGWFIDVLIDRMLCMINVQLVA